MVKKILYSILLGLIGLIVSTVLSPFIAVGFIWYITVTSFKTGYNWDKQEIKDKSDGGGDEHK
jgi:hypothetical protein